MVRPAPRSDDELLLWASDLVRRAQRNKMFGVLTITFEQGCIVRAQTQVSELPPRVEKKVVDAG